MFRKKEPIEFKKWHAVVLGVVVVVCIILRLWPKEKQSMAIELGGQTLSVLVANTIPEQIQGLSDRDTIHPHDGMLFIFGDKQFRTMVMRRMRFSIDILWIEGDIIVDVIANLPPESDRIETELTRYTGRSLADKVLELPAGFVDKYGIKIGDRIKY